MAILSWLSQHRYISQHRHEPPLLQPHLPSDPQIAITSEFGKQAPKAWADYADSKMRQAKAGNDPAEAAKWGEGGSYRILGHAVLGAAASGTSGAAGALASASVMPEVGRLLDQTELPESVKQGLGMVASATLGSIVGGVQGAATALTVDVNNRQLHLTETQLAVQLAAKGKYTKAQIEEQMRLMGNDQYHETPNTTALLIGSEAIVNSVGQDPGMPKTISGNVAVEIAGQANLEIQQYIMANSKDGAGFIPGQTAYTPSNPALNKPVRTYVPPQPVTLTANCGNNDLACKSGVGLQQSEPISQQTRDTIADVASNLSRQAGVVAAGATAVGSQAGPYGKPAQAVAVGATVIGGVADVVEQVARPNVGQTAANSTGVIVTELINKKVPLAAPLTNELIEAAKGSKASNVIQEKLNQSAQGVSK